MVALLIQQHSRHSVPATYSNPLLSLCLSLPLSVSLMFSVLFTQLHAHSHTHGHNDASKFFQGISRLINRLVVWGSSEVQRSRLNPPTGRIISGRWVHTSPVAPHKPLPSWLDLWQKISPFLSTGYQRSWLQPPDRETESWCEGESNRVRRGWNNISKSRRIGSGNVPSFHTLWENTYLPNWPVGFSELSFTERNVDCKTTSLGLML